MATSGTPNEGLDAISNRVYTSDGTLQLRLYVNLADSLDADTVFADIVEPTGTGYAPESLTGVFSETDGIVTYDDGTPDDVIFENTESEGGSNWSQAVNGVILYDVTNNAVLHFNDLSVPITMTPGKKLKIDLSTLIAP